MSYAVVLTTCANQDQAKTIARALVDQRLAACVQMLPIASVYRWRGEVEEAAEILLFIKIKSEDYAGVEKAIRALHDYETPEIVALPIAEGSADCLKWIEEVTRKEDR
jgi:periplasmic divalent cation tolerance protein